MKQPILLLICLTSSLLKPSQIKKSFASKRNDISFRLTLNKKMWESVQNNDASQLTNLFYKQGENIPNINAVNDQGQTPLVFTLIQNDRSGLNLKYGVSDMMVALVLNAKANVNLSDSTGVTPLMYAVRNDEYKQVKLLLENEAYVNARNKEGKTVLMLAIERNCSPTIINLLAIFGADPAIINEQDEKKMALDYASTPEDKKRFQEAIIKGQKYRSEKTKKIRVEVTQIPQLIPPIADIVAEYAC